AGSVSTNGLSSVKLFWAGWHVPQVRPLPLNFSSKNTRAPAHTETGTRPLVTRGSWLQTLTGSVSADVTRSTGSSVGAGPASLQATPASSGAAIKTRLHVLVTMSVRSSGGFRATGHAACAMSSTPLATGAPVEGRGLSPSDGRSCGAAVHFVVV